MITACCVRALPRGMSRVGMHGLLTLHEGMPISTTRHQFTRSVRRCRIVKDRIRLRKEGVRDVVVALCCALHIFRVRRAP